MWKGAVSFGWFTFPWEMYSAARSSALDLTLLDSRDFAPVGYQRINKRTSKVVEWGDIVKGYEYKKGEYVALSDEDFRQANVKASQTIEITSFTSAAEIAPEYYENPYYLIPTKGGEKGYAFTARAPAAHRQGSSWRRCHTRQAALWSDRRGQARAIVQYSAFCCRTAFARHLDVATPDSKSANVSPKEVAMAEKLLEEMSAPWKPEEYHDTYREDLMRRIKEKVHKRQTHVLTPKEKAPREGQRARR